MLRPTGRSEKTRQRRKSRHRMGARSACGRNWYQGRWPHTREHQRAGADVSGVGLAAFGGADDRSPLYPRFLTDVGSDKPITAQIWWQMRGSATGLKFRCVPVPRAGLLRFPPVRLCMGNSGTTLAATPERARMGYGVIGNTLDSDSSIPGSSPGTPANLFQANHRLSLSWLKARGPGAFGVWWFG